MSKSYGLKRFAKIDFLRKIRFDLFLLLVAPFRAYLEMKGATWSEDAASFPFETLTKILASPGDDTPVELYDTLYFVDEMSGEEIFDKLYKDALEAGIDFTGYGDLTPHDLAAFIWLQNPELLQRLHAGLHITKARRFEAFFGKPGNVTPNISPEAITDLENALNEYFDSVKKGQGVRVFVFPKDDGLWLMVRHGLPMKREAAIADDGKSKGVLFRPEIYDVLLIPSSCDELHIHTSTAGEKRAYCKLIGEYLFHERDFFTFNSDTPKFTLDPLMIDGRKCLVCSQIEGIELATWVEARFRIAGDLHHLVTHKADCVFTAFERSGGVPEGYELYRVSFRVKFIGERRTRIVTLCPPKTAIFERESDSVLIEQLLKNGHFTLKTSEDRSDEYAILSFKFAVGDARTPQSRIKSLAGVAR